jgi:response regulator of citrate/malate metabolism
MALSTHEERMKKTRFTEEQIVTILRETDEKSVPEVAEKHGVSSQTAGRYQTAPATVTQISERPYRSRSGI